MNTDAPLDTLSTPDAPPSTIHPSQYSAAKIIGILYPLQMATGVFGEMFARRQLIVRGDPAKTAQNIIDGETLFRLSILGDLITYILVDGVDVGAVCLAATG
jgi:hypothetical protein